MVKLAFQWEEINTVLLDMDGTLLDLNFDNHFWKEFVPCKYAEKNSITIDEAYSHLFPRFKQMEGKLEWYCLDYWSEVLELDIVGLKSEIAGLISVLPHVMEFLEWVKASTKTVLLVTNAHRDGINLKMEKTCLHHFFDDIVSSHDFKQPKEKLEFWHHLQSFYPFDRQNTVLIDDNIEVLNAAKEYGIQHLVSISKPDSKMPKRTIIGYPSIEDFRELMAGL